MGNLRQTAIGMRSATEKSILFYGTVRVALSDCEDVFELCGKGRDSR